MDKEIVGSTNHCHDSLTLGEIHSVPSMFLNLKNHPQLHSATYIAFFQTPGIDGLSDTCRMLKTVARSNNNDRLELRNFHLTFYVNAQVDIIQGNGDWETFAQEVLRIAFDINGGLFALPLNMLYQIPSDYLAWTHRGGNYRPDPRAIRKRSLRSWLKNDYRHWRIVHRSVLINMSQLWIIGNTVRTVIRY